MRKPKVSIQPTAAPKKGTGKDRFCQVRAVVCQQAGCGVATVVLPLMALVHDQVGALHEASFSQLHAAL